MIFYLVYLLVFHLRFYLAYLLAFYLPVEVQQCTLSWEGPRLRSSGAHWAGQIPGWGPVVYTGLGRSQVEVQRCTLSWDGSWLRSSGARWAGKVPGWGPAVPHWAGKVPGWGPAVQTELDRSQVEVPIHTELANWQRAWRRVGKAEVEVEIDADMVEEKLEGGGGGRGGGGRRTASRGGGGGE